MFFLFLGLLLKYPILLNSNLEIKNIDVDSSVLYLTEIWDFCSKDGLSWKDRLFPILFMWVGLGCQHIILGIFYAPGHTVEHIMSCFNLLKAFKSGHNNIHEVHVTYSFNVCHSLMWGSFKIQSRNVFLRTSQHPSHTLIM